MSLEQQQPEPHNPRGQTTTEIPPQNDLQSPSKREMKATHMRRPPNPSENLNRRSIKPSLPRGKPHQPPNLDPLGTPTKSPSPPKGRRRRGEQLGINRRSRMSHREGDHLTGAPRPSPLLLTPHFHLISPPRPLPPRPLTLSMTTGWFTMTSKGSMAEETWSEGVAGPVLD